MIGFQECTVRKKGDQRTFLRNKKRCSSVSTSERVGQNPWSVTICAEQIKKDYNKGLVRIS